MFSFPPVVVPVAAVAFALVMLSFAPARDFLSFARVAPRWPYLRWRWSLVVIAARCECLSFAE